MQKRILILTIFFVLLNLILNGSLQAQCCGGGGGSPVAGGSSQGVLNENQIEVNMNYQYINTSKSYINDKVDNTYNGKFSSQYSYTRIAYGLSKKFTFSLESGYWLNKTEVDKNNNTYKNSGIGDLIIFPRYNLLNLEKNHKKTEITLGIGLKIPLGRYNDSTYIISSDPFLDNYYVSNPLSVQTSSGSQDFIFYGFLSRSYSFYNFRIFANALYVKKGWNPIGEKIGDYSSLGLFASKTIFNNLGLTFQIKAEWISKMKLNETVRENKYPNYDPEATGSKKIFAVPQISYSYKGFVLYALSELPVYQYVTKSQIASQFQTTIGLSYRFIIKKACAIEAVKL